MSIISCTATITSGTNTIVFVGAGLLDNGIKAGCEVKFDGEPNT